MLERLAHKQYTWLITGVAGFIGSHLLEFLLNHHQTVIGLDNFSTGFKHNLIHTDAWMLIEGDIRDLETCKKACQGVDFVLHEAALGSVPRSIQNPLPSHDVNSTGFLNLLIAIQEAKVKRLVYASSSSVYGDIPDLPKVEHKLGKPLSPYAVTKMTNELYAQAFATCYDLQTIGLRYFNVFGARQNPNGPYAAVIPLWVQALLKDEPVYINGDGSTSRDFCYIDNVVQATLLAALTENQAAVNQVYNVAVGERTTLNELYFHLAKLLGKEERAPIYRSFREGDIQHSLASIEKARALLAYEPTHTLQQGLSAFLLAE